MAEENNNTVQYTDDNIRHLSDMEHVRTRPGMYIGRLGDGNLPEDGIYVLLKEDLNFPDNLGRHQQFHHIYE